MVAGVVGHLLTVTFGAAVGAMLARPVVERAGTTFLVVGVVTLVQTVVPNCPPTRQLLELFDESPPRDLVIRLVSTAGQTVAIAAALVAAALVAAKRRS